jgi:FkbM family methyltransferase
MQIQQRSFCGHTFNVVEPASLGFPRHTLATFDDHEPPFIKNWPLIRPDERVIDAGPCFGSYTLTAIAMGASVLAYDPFDEGCAILSANIEVNPGFTERFTLVKKALFDGGPYPTALGFEVWTQHYPSKEKVQLTTIDEDLAARPDQVIDWLKLDVEGAELGVLVGADKMILRDRPTLIVEDHDNISNNMVSNYPRSIDSSVRIQRMMKKWGYDVEVQPHEFGRRYIVGIHPSRPSHLP